MPEPQRDGGMRSMTERAKRTVGDACPYRKAPSGRELASVCETEGEREKRAGIQDFLILAYLLFLFIIYGFVGWIGIISFH